MKLLMDFFRTVRVFPFGKGLPSQSLTPQSIPGTDRSVDRLPASQKIKKHIPDDRCGEAGWIGPAHWYLSE
jgi:hypothetical protein